MSRFRSEVLGWFDAGRVVPGREASVLRAGGMMPGRAEWRVFLGLIGLWLGALALAASVIFFFAFNWNDLTRFAKFGLVEAAILGGLLACWRADMDGMIAKAVLVLLSLMTGALLALTGQVYQTGADSADLFLYWALLILPWVMVGRFSPLWLLWIALVDMTVFLHFQLSWTPEPMLWALFGVNSLALILWEAGHRFGLSWLADEWPPRLIAIASGATATALMLWAILDAESVRAGGGLAALAYLVWLASFYAWYRHARPDLFMLAGGLLSLIVAIVAWLSKAFAGHDESTGFLFIGLVVIGLSAGGAVWLRSVGRAQAE